MSEAWKVKGKDPIVPSSYMVADSFSLDVFTLIVAVLFNLCLLELFLCEKKKNNTLAFD